MESPAEMTVYMNYQRLDGLSLRLYHLDALRHSPQTDQVKMDPDELCTASQCLYISSLYITLYILTSGIPSLIQTDLPANHR